MKIRKGSSLLSVIFFSGWTIVDMGPIVRKNSSNGVGSPKAKSRFNLVYYNRIYEVIEENLKFYKVYVMCMYIIGILAIALVASLFLTNSQFSLLQQQVMGQQQEAAIGQKIVQQGTVSSDVDPLKGHEGHQAAVILPPRNDSAVYSGTLTFTASKPVQVAVINMYNLDNETASQIPEKFGQLLTAQAPWNTSAIVTPLMMNVEYLDSPTMSKSVPFVGNLIALHTMDGEPFIANYAVVADVLQPQIVNNLDSAMGK